MIVDSFDSTASHSKHDDFNLCLSLSFWIHWQLPLEKKQCGLAAISQRTAANEATCAEFEAGVVFVKEKPRLWFFREEMNRNLGTYSKYRVDTVNCRKVE